MSTIVVSEASVDNLLRAMTVALGAARATERRAAWLLATAKAPPAARHLARGIYLRAKARSERLQGALDELASDLDVGAMS